MTGRLSWLVCVAVSVLVGAGLQTLAIPGCWLLAGAVVAGGVAVLGRVEIVPPRRLLGAAQGLVAVLAALPLSDLRAGDIGRFGLLAVATTVTTLGLSLGCGVVLTRWYRDLTPTTGMIALIAGGASTISTIADELGAEPRFVAFVQYLRLVAVTVTLPLVAGGLGGHAGGPPTATAHGWLGVAATVAIVLVGGPLGRRVRLPAAALLGPLALGAALAITAPGGIVPVEPEVLKDAAFLVVGWQAGGTFSAAVLVRFSRYLPGVALAVLATVAGCFGLAALTSAMWHIPLLDAYLATSPGGIYSVLAIAHDTAAGPVVDTLQVLRMVVMLLAAVLISTFFRPRRRVQAPSGEPAAPRGERIRS